MCIENIGKITLNAHGGCARNVISIDGNNGMTDEQTKIMNEKAEVFRSEYHIMADGWDNDRHVKYSKYNYIAGFREGVALSEQEIQRIIRLDNSVMKRKNEDNNKLQSQLAEKDKIIAELKEMQSALDKLKEYRDKGPYKLVIQAYAKDTTWTLKAYHKDGYSKSCTTSDEDFISLINKALKRVEGENAK